MTRAKKQIQSDVQLQTANSELKQSDRHFALILAAGRSTRMGTCKTTLPWHNGQSLLHYQAEQFLLAGITPIIVLGSHNAYRRSDCPPSSKVAIAFNSNLGKTSSILTGLRSLPQSFSSITISAVDQPRSSDVYQTLLQAYIQETPAIVAPYCRGKLGHPLLFSFLLLPLLKDIRESSLGLRKVVSQFYSDIKKVEFATSEVLIDLNNHSKYQLELQKISSSENYS